MLLQSDTLHIGFFGKGKTAYPEDIVAPAVLRALAQHLKVDLQTEGVFWGDYCYFAGVTGEAFRFLDVVGLQEKPESRPLVERYGQITLAEMYRLSLDAAGLDFQLYPTSSAAERETLRRLIAHSLDQRQTPVIALGGFGPPEPSLITGYDAGADVLLGWSHFQEQAKENANLAFEPTGEFRLRYWPEALDGVIVVTGPKPATPRRAVYLDALRRGIRELGTTAWERGTLGTATMAEWAARLEADATFAALSAEALKAAQSAHSAMAGEHAERRALASSFVELATRFLPEAAGDLHDAGAAFQGAHDTVYEFWETIAKTGPFDPDLEKFADPARRRVMAGLVRRLIALDERARRSLERAVAVVDGADPGPRVTPDPLLEGNITLEKAAPASPPAGPWAPQTIPLPNAMGMLASFLGVSLDRFAATGPATGSAAEVPDYALWMGLTGAAFGWPGDGPERGNVALAMDALGYDYELWLSRALADETGLVGRTWGWDDNLRRRIFWNLRDRGLPVLLFNCGAWPDWYLVTRAEGWFTLLGYGGVHDGAPAGAPLDHPLNSLRPIPLFEGMKGRQTWTINVTGKRKSAPPPEELYRRALAWGAAQLRAPRRESFGGKESELAERRRHGAAFLDLAAAHMKDDRLRHAAERFRNVSRLVERLGEAGDQTDLLHEIELEEASVAADLDRVS
jgi:hypothetical protein